MELFKGVKAVRLLGPHDKFLVADEDEESVTQGYGSSCAARWTVELVDGDRLRLKSCYGLYLTASMEPFLFGMTGRKVLQTDPSRLDSSTEWEPVSEGFQVKLKTMYGHFLRANGGLWPWRNSVTHHIPQSTHDILWDVDIVDLHVPQSPTKPPVVVADTVSTTPPKLETREFLLAVLVLFILWWGSFSEPAAQDGRPDDHESGDVDAGLKERLHSLPKVRLLPCLRGKLFLILLFAIFALGGRHLLARIW